MTDDLKERLRHADEYEPLGHDGWEALARITDLEAKLQRLGRELNLAKYGEPDFAWEIHKNAVAELEARLAAAEAERDYWQKDSAAAWDKCEERRLQAVAAEAGEDALAEALRPFGFFSDEPNTTQQAWEIRYCDRFEDWIDFGDMESARDALAAHDARRKG